jgi:hypothetical protein
MGKQQDDTRMSWTATLLALPPIGVLFISDILSWRFAWQGPAPKLAELSAAQLAKLCPAKLAGLSPAKLAELGSARLGELCPAKLADLSPEKLAELSPEMLRLDASARLLMLAAALVGFGLVYLIALRFVADLRDEFGPRTRAWLLGWYTGGITVGTLWVLTGCMQVPIEHQLGPGVVEGTVALLGKAGGAQGTWLFDGFLSLTLANRLAVMLGAGIVVTGGVSTLVDPVRPLGADEARAFLIHQRRRLRTYVNAAAALLVVSLAFQIAWMRWPLVALDPAIATMLGRQVDAHAVFTGVTGSVVIALFAVPASTILAAKAAALPPMQGDTASVPLLDASLLPSIGKVLVVLAPTIAGSLPLMLDVLGNVVGT